MTIFILAFSLYASSDALDTDTSLLGLKYSALESVSYYGAFSNIFVNPASLPLLKGSKDYQISYSPSESYNTDLFGNEKLSFMQNLTSELQGTVVSGPVSLSAKISSALDNRTLRSDGVYYDIYSSFDIELSLAYSFLSHFSIGARLGGGNSVARLSKRLDGIIDTIGNAWFSPYDQLSNSERFNANLGALVYSNNFSIGLVFDDLFSVSLDSSFFNKLVTNTTVGLSFKGDEYNSDGDLKYLVPRLSVDLKGIGFSSGERRLTVQGDITLQFLKDVLLDAGVKYSYSVSSTDESTSNIAFTLLGTYSDFSLLFNVVILNNTGETLRPSIVFSYST